MRESELDPLIHFTREQQKTRQTEAERNKAIATKEEAASERDIVIADNRVTQNSKIWNQRKKQIFEAEKTF